MLADMSTRYHNHTILEENIDPSVNTQSPLNYRVRTSGFSQKGLLKTKAIHTTDVPAIRKRKGDAIIHHLAIVRLSNRLLRARTRE